MAHYPWCYRCLWSAGGPSFAPNLTPWESESQSIGFPDPAPSQHAWEPTHVVGTVPQVSGRPRLALSGGPQVAGTWAGLPP